MNTTDTFSFSRFGWVLKRDLTENWKLNLLSIIGLYALLTVILILNLSFSKPIETKIIEGIPYTQFDKFCSSLSSSLILAFLFIGYYASSRIMKPMQNKTTCTAYLTLPATACEKFLVRFVIVTAGFTLAYLIALILQEITYQLIIPLFDVPDNFHCTLFSARRMGILSDFDYTMDTRESSYHLWLAQLCIYMEMLWAGSLFMIGGVFWRKKALLKTICVLTALILLIGIQNFFIIHLRNWYNTDKNLIIASAIFFLLILFNWWLSYRIFKRSQIVKPKFGLL